MVTHAVSSLKTMVDSVYKTSRCVFGVSNQPRYDFVMEPCVFHMQHLVKRWKTRSWNLFYGPQYMAITKGSIKICSFASGMMVFGGGVSNMALAEGDPTCLDYYTVGESTCRPAASTPVNPPLAPPPAKETFSEPIKVKSAVDEYMEGYGKPPREFVEFYLNPTTENANKWMLAYRHMVQKGNDLSKAWQDADQLYTSMENDPVTLLKAPAPEIEQAVSSSKTISKSAAPLETAAVPTLGSIGAFSSDSNVTDVSLGGIRAPTINLTYYFSQTCPYCARTTPQLSEIAKQTKSKLVFTCVDVTPLGATSRPNEAFITSKLPCKWRLPADGEVERESIRQTPTILIQKEGAQQVRLSGYVPLVQLKQYF